MKRPSIRRREPRPSALAASQTLTSQRPLDSTLRQYLGEYLHKQKSGEIFINSLSDSPFVNAGPVPTAEMKLFHVGRFSLKISSKLAYNKNSCLLLVKFYGTLTLIEKHKRMLRKRSRKLLASNY